MNFIVYDVTLLIIFFTFVSLFLYKNRKNLKREGLLFLYRTKWGMKLIDKIGKKYKKTLKVLSYISITIGYFLMATMLYLFGKIVYLYVLRPDIVQAIKIPPITPLFPYLPQAFNLNFLPPLYFVTFIIIIALAAIPHEFAHGIFMRRYGVKVKSTGFGFFPFFFPIFLAAFVEQDQKSMEKTSIFKQKAILSAGTFANILTAILFFVVMILFFNLAFNASGVVYDNYAYGLISLGSVSSINNVMLENASYSQILGLIEENKLNKIGTENGDYILTQEFLEEQTLTLSEEEKNNLEYLYVYYDSPAINAGMENVIVKINENQIEDIEDLTNELDLYSPGDKIILETNQQEYEITLDERPDNLEGAWLGIVFEESQKKGVVGSVVAWLSSFKESHINYIPKFNGANFIYNLLWWVVLACFSIAFVNMLPMGIFDGGRFFYLTILGLTKSEKKAKKWFAASTSILLSLIILLMIFWAISWII